MSATKAGDAAVVALGTIVNTHGIRGELRLLPYNPDTDALQPGMEVTIARDGSRTRLTIESVRRHKRFILFTAAGVGTATAAEALVGAEIEVPAATLPPVAEGEAYYFELVGMAVVTTGGTALGTVAEVFRTAANDVCVVRDGARELLIPMVADIVTQVDRAAARIVIEPMPGLLDDP